MGRSLAAQWRLRAGVAAHERGVAAREREVAACELGVSAHVWNVK